jgi:hypothetical protein
MHPLTLELKFIFGVPTSNRIKEQFDTVIPNTWSTFKDQAGGIISCQIRRRKNGNRVSFQPVYNWEIPPIEMPPIELGPLEGSNNTEAVGQRLRDPIEGPVEGVSHSAQLPHDQNQDDVDLEISQAVPDDNPLQRARSEHEELEDDAAANSDDRLAELLEQGIPLLEQVVPLLQQRQRRNI